MAAVIAAFVLGLVNTLIRPIFLILTLPVTLITLGLFIFVINGLMFWFAGSILKGFVVDSFWNGVLGAVLYSVFSWALSSAAAQLMGKK
jgi:putative membrane protein